MQVHGSPWIVTYREKQKLKSTSGKPPQRNTMAHSSLNRYFMVLLWQAVLGNQRYDPYPLKTKRRDFKKRQTYVCCKHLQWQFRGGIREVGKFPGEGKAGLGLEVGRMYTWQGEKRTRCAELYGAWQIQRERQVYQQGVWKTRWWGGQGLAYKGLMLGT